MAKKPDRKKPTKAPPPKSPPKSAKPAAARPARKPELKAKKPSAKPVPPVKKAPPPPKKVETPAAKKKVAAVKPAPPAPRAKEVVEEIKKPARTHLKKPELDRYRQVLLTKRDLLVGDLQSLESQAFRASEQDSSANHMADFGSDNYEQDFNLGLIENDEEAIHDIDDAIRRIDARQYGICGECGVEIPNARLEAIPWARLCVQCQALNEQF